MLREIVVRVCYIRGRRWLQGSKFVTGIWNGISHSHSGLGTFTSHISHDRNDFQFVSQKNLKNQNLKKHT